MIQSLLMRHFDRSRVEIHVACNAGSPDQPSAAWRALSKLSDVHLRPTNFGPTVFALSRREKLLNAARGLPGMTDLARLAAYARRHRIQLIHGTEKPRDAFYGALLAQAVGARAITHMHVKAEGWISPLSRWAMRRDDGIIGVSQFVADSVIAMGYSPNRVYHVLNGLDASRWNWRTDGSDIRREYGISAEAPLVAVISRLFHWKGHIDLVRALAIVRQSMPQARLLIVGEDDARGAPDRGSFTAELKALIRELGQDEAVIFAGFRSDIQCILAACDIYAMPSFEEPAAVVFLEAMAMKKPIVALESGGVPELVQHGKAGLLSAPKDIDQLAANLLWLVRDPELRRRMGEFGRMDVETRLTPRQMANDCEAIYRKILGLPAAVV
jgi:glycosyltransferase involved in cell wall biosynthesis